MMKHFATFCFAACLLCGCQNGVPEKAAAPSTKAPDAAQQSTVNAGGDQVPAPNQATGDGSEGIRSVSPSTPGDR